MSTVHPLFARALVAIALLSGAPASAQSAADRLEGPIPEEVQAYREAAKRVHQRLDEIAEDTRQYVNLREVEESTKLTTSYDTLLASLKDSDATHRDAAIVRLEAFISRYESEAVTSGVRFRLAELYYEQAKERYLVESETYFRAAESEDLAVLESLGEPPKQDLSLPIAQYQRIIDDNLKLPKEERWEYLDGVFVMLGFSYFLDESAQQDQERAKQIFRQLIAECPESELADRSYLFLGNTAFAASDYQGAIAEYEQVLAKGPDTDYYEEAQYQLAWARFKLNEYDEAVKLFGALLDQSERQREATGRESNYAPDARRFLAFSFADMANMDGSDAVVLANRYFARPEIGRKPYEHEVYVQLGDVLKRYDRSDEAIHLYEYIQDGPGGVWTYHPENPSYQNEVVTLFSQQKSVMLDREGNLQRAGDERLYLTTTYGEQSEWWRQNRNEPDALAAARDYIESELLEVAREYYIRADVSGEPAAFAVAAQKYQEYLDAFPIADDYYEQQWYLANALKKAESWPNASTEFERMFRSRRYHVYGDSSLYELMNARLRVMQDASGPPGASCPGCKVFENGGWTGGDGAASWAVERTYASKGEKPVDIPVYALPQDRADFVEAAEVLVDHQWTEIDPRKLPENFPDYKAAFTERRHQFMYLVGQTLYYANRYDEARKRLTRVVDEYPRTDEASYAAGLIVDSYVAEGDLEQVRKWTRTFSTMVLGPNETPNAQFQSLLEKSSFELANDIARRGDYIGAAEAFLGFIEEFPSSENTPSALNNAAFYYQEAGKLETSAELYERFVEQYPTRDESRKIYYRIAANYEATFDLEKAIDFYTRLYTRFPDDVNAADALWEASFLKTGLGQHAEAAKGFEEYAKRYPEREDREETFWRAGEQWERVGDAEALAFYKRYLDTYGLTNPDHAIEADYRVALIYERKGDTRGYEKQLDKIVDTYDKIRSKGATVGAAGIKYAAAAEYRYLERDFATYSKDTLSGNEDKDLALLTDRKPAELKEFEGKTKAFVSKYAGNFEWNSGALYLQGMAALYYADLGLSIKCPKNLAEEDCWAYEEALEESVFPQYYAVEEVGKKKLVELVELARSQKKHSKFIDRALEELNRRDPLAHPAVKTELRGQTNASAPLKLTPRDSLGQPFGTKPADAPEGSSKDPAETPAPDAPALETPAPAPQPAPQEQP